ncbi:helix-turn-helix transcriptional regulator [Frateuria soli]|uniref:helix-turn-helix transcriptional regulator n=1 Tax=Frateuria soli TaxID=1542730 RepID=UPI001E50A93B|nr:helix-turn-helix transcriptional regulator [Frateuria soli]UGB37204.1 helix-turn-helix transcriptional regulator [Frateuria soli]
MDRCDLRPALDALYGMDLAAPDWAPFLQSLASVFRSHVVAVQAHDPAQRHGQVSAAIGVEPGLLERYESLAGEHPWFERGSTVLVARGVADDRGLMAERELRATRFHAEFMQHARIGHGFALCMERGASGEVAVLTVNRDWAGGYYDQAELAAARRLLPHLQRVHALARRLGPPPGLARQFRQALDLMHDGVLLLGRSGRVLFANLAAQALQAQRLFRVQPDARVRLPWPADHRRLQRLLATLDDEASPAVMALHDRGGVLQGMLRLCSAAPMAAEQWAEPQACTIGFVKAVSLPVADPRALQWQWDFTPAEALLANRLLEGLSLSEAADSLGVTRNTVRTQLRALFDKTQTRRQADLVGRLLRLSHPNPGRVQEG